jgi:hypothetical protein
MDNYSDGPVLRPTPLSCGRLLVCALSKLLEVKSKLCLAKSQSPVADSNKSDIQISRGRTKPTGITSLNTNYTSISSWSLQPKFLYWIIVDRKLGQIKVIPKGCIEHIDWHSLESSCLGDSGNSFKTQSFP